MKTLALLLFKKISGRYHKQYTLAIVSATNPFEPKRIGQYILINLVLALMVQVFICPSCYTSWDLFIGGVDNLCYSFLISLFLSAGISFIINKADKYFPWLEAPVSRFIFDVLVVITYTFIVSFCLATIFTIFVWDYFTFENVGWSDILRSTKLPIYISLGITLFMTGRSFLLEWRSAAIQAEQMKSERLKWQYQSLKDQLNPHFLFNSLNVLSNLVYENADQANAFIEKLASIYRYVLDVQYEELVSLQKEVDFAQNYLQLQELRFGAKLSYAIEVEENLELNLPPLTLQLLLENAVKHNAATKTNPLKIKIRKTGNCLTVTNSFHPRSTTSGKSGIGLTNIKERYAFLTDREVKITPSEESFEVSVPLLNAQVKP